MECSATRFYDRNLPSVNELELPPTMPLNVIFKIVHNPFAYRGAILAGANAQREVEKYYQNLQNTRNL
jgi:hypothetical protein